MCFQIALKEELSRTKLPQKEVARRANVSPSLISKIKSGESVTFDSARAISKALNAPHLLAEYATDEGLGLLNIPLLNNIDKHPIVVLNTFKQEAEEAIAASDLIETVIKNKRSKQDLTNEQVDLLTHYMDQIVDLVPAINILVVCMREFGIDPKELEEKNIEKLIEKGYHIKKRATHKRIAII